MATSDPIDDFINSAHVQRTINDFLCGTQERRVAEKLGITRREARAALKLTGRWLPANDSRIRPEWQS